MPKTTRVAAVQAEPAWNDLQGGVDKVCALIAEAGEKGVNVLGFPEVFIPGYPWSIWTKAVFDNMPFIHEYRANSLKRESPEMDRIRAAAREAGILVVLGYSEADGSSVYIAQSFINLAGEIVLHRRKIKPTHVERSIWGDGQADSLKCVVDTPFGKVGGLNCWEHLQPLLRYYEYSQGVEIHVAGWPPIFSKAEGRSWMYSMTPEAGKMISQFMAIEGSTFVLVSTQVLTERSREKTNLTDRTLLKTLGGGFATIVGPDGTPLVESLDPNEEGILCADINLEDRQLASQLLDVVGHYSRPDLLSLRVNAETAKHVHLE